jgi:hypothetical protein
MGMCKSCGVVYSALIMKDGYCKDCKPELFTEEEKIQIEKNEMIGSNHINVEVNEESSEKENQTCGIVSCVLSVLSLFTGVIGIVFAIIGLICGIQNSKNAFGIIGIIVSSIYLFVFLLSVLGFVSILALN